MSRSELRAFAGVGFFLVFMIWGFLLFSDNHLYGLLFIPALVGLCLILFAGQQSNEEVEEAEEPRKAAWQPQKKKKKHR